MADIRPDVARIDRLVVVVAVFLAVRGDPGKHPSLFVPPAGHMVPPLPAPGQRNAGQVKEIFVALRVEQDHVVFPGEIPLRPPAALIAPDDLVEEPDLAEHLVAHDPGRRRHSPVKVQVEHTRLRQQLLPDGNDPPQEPQVLLLAGIPVLVRRIARSRRPRPPSLLAVRTAAYKLLPGHEGRVHIDALCLPGQRPDLFRQFHHASADQQVLPVAEHFPVHRNLFKHVPGLPALSGVVSVPPVLLQAYSGMPPAPRPPPAGFRLPARLP